MHRMTIGYATRVFTGVLEELTERFGLNMTWIDASRSIEDADHAELAIPGTELKKMLKDKKNKEWIEDDKYYAWHTWNCVVYGNEGEDDEALRAFEDYVINEYDWLDVPVVHGLEITLDLSSASYPPSKCGYIVDIGFYAEIPKDGGYVWLR